MKSSSYKCVVTDRNGTKKTFTVEGENELAVMKSFKGTEYIPLKITSLSSSSSKKMQKANAKSILEFTQMMEQLINSGLSIKDSLEVLSLLNDRNNASSNIASQILSQVEKGVTFSDAVNSMSDVFPSVYRGIISVGNRIGSVEHIFPRLRIYLETSKKIKDKFKGALAYPMVVLATAVFGLIAMMVFVFPKLQKMFEEFGGEAATILQKNMDRIKNISIVLFSIIVLIFAVCIIINLLSKKNEKIKNFMDSLLLKVPLVSKFFIYWDTLNFAFAMETLTSGGVTIENAIQEASYVIANSSYKKALSDVNEDIIKGISLSDAFRKRKIFPDYMIKWMSVGEKSGKPEQIFSQIRTYFQSAIEKYINRFMTLIEPALIVLIGVILLLFVVTIIVPIFNLYGSIL